MTKDELIIKIRDIIESDTGYGFEMYACLKVKDQIECAPFMLEDKDGNSFKDALGERISDCISDMFLSNDIDLKQSDDIHDNTKSYYEIVQNDIYNPFGFILSTRGKAYSDDEKENLFGFLFKYNVNQKSFLVYQQVYPVTIPKKKKGIFVYSSSNVYKEFSKELLRIDYRIDILLIDNSIITGKIELLQSKFGFEQYIRHESQKAMQMIKDLSIIEDIKKIEEFEGNSKLTNAKKLMKIKNSPVLKMDPSILIQNLKTKPRYKDKLVIQNDTIKITSKKDVKELLKILNDDYLTSELTNEDYESSNKKLEKKSNDE